MRRVISRPQFAALPEEQLVVAEMVVLDWHDGPREGFVRFEHPVSTWYFRLYAESPNPDGVDDGLFLFAATPDDTFSRLHEALRPLGPPPRPFWTPVWRFPDDRSRETADSTVADMVGRIGPAELVVESQDLSRLSRVWLTVPPSG